VLMLILPHCIVSPCSENNKTTSKHTDVILRSSRHRHAHTQKEEDITQKKLKEKSEDRKSVGLKKKLVRFGF